MPVKMVALVPLNDSGCFAPLTISKWINLFAKQENGAINLNYLVHFQLIFTSFTIIR